MSGKRIGVIAFALGIVAGLVLRDQLDRPSELRVQQALAALERARDSVLSLPATIVQVTDTGASHTILRVIRERVTDTVTQIRTTEVPVRVLDTVWVGGGDGFAWDFVEQTAAYGLSGTCHANLVDPSLSFTTYTLDVHQKEIESKRWRVYAMLGIYGQRPFIGANVRLTDRVMVGPMFGSATGAEWWDLTWGMQTSIGLF
jgi:hypothetical protein